MIGGTTLFPYYAAPPKEPRYDFEIPSTDGGVFHLDLRVGQQQERELFGDLFAPAGDPVKVEVKTDRKFGKTGNVAVEFEYRTKDGKKKPSGIAVTEANQFVFVLGPKSRLFVETERIKELARQAILADKHAWVGDDNRFHCALIPVKWIGSWD